jgi:uncharacterized protein (TIGR02466 family)
MVFTNIFADKNSNKNEPRSDAEMTVFQNFPVLMGMSRIDLSQAKTDDITGKVLKIYTDYPNAPKNNIYVNRWQKRLNNQELPLFRDLFWAIDSKVKLYLKRLKYDNSSLYMSNVYLTIGGKNSYINRHVHPSSEFLSGCFYIKTPGGEFSFYNPVEFQSMPFLENKKDLPPEWALTRKTINPFPGLLLLFPSHLSHGTNLNPTDELRISLAFNYRYKIE